MNVDLAKLQEMVVKFRDEREWKQFHNPKDTAISLLLESAEFLEHFQWKSDEEITQHLKYNKDQVADELSDVLYWVLLISNDLKIPLNKSLLSKMRQNELKYPVDKSKGKHTKYNKL